MHYNIIYSHPELFRCFDIIPFISYKVNSFKKNDTITGGLCFEAGANGGGCSLYNGVLCRGDHWSSAVQGWQNNASACHLRAREKNAMRLSLSKPEGQTALPFGSRRKFELSLINNDIPNQLSARSDLRSPYGFRLRALPSAQDDSRGAMSRGIGYSGRAMRAPTRNGIILWSPAQINTRLPF